MTCLLRRLELDDGHWKPVSWGAQLAPEGFKENWEYDKKGVEIPGDRDECLECRTSYPEVALLPIEADCRRCLWFYKRFVDEQLKKAMDRHTAALMAPFVFKVTDNG